jgi:hypothetical protein
MGTVSAKKVNRFTLSAHRRINNTRPANRQEARITWAEMLDQAERGALVAQGYYCGPTCKCEKSFRL